MAVLSGGGGGCGHRAEDGTSLPARFAVAAPTLDGSRVLAVGGSPALGEWLPEFGLALLTGPETYPVWSCQVHLPAAALAAEPVEYKFVIQRPDGEHVWEEGPNRRVLQHQILETGCSKQELKQGSEEGTGCEKANICHFGVFPSNPDADDRLPSPLLAPSPSLDAKKLGPLSMRKVGTVTWQAVCTSTSPGDALVLLGSCPRLGGWDPSCGLHLATSPATYPMWHVTVNLAISEMLAPWKLVILRSDGDVYWEEGDNRRLEMPGHGSCVIRTDFGGDADVVVGGAVPSQTLQLVPPSGASPRKALLAAAAGTPPLLPGGEAEAAEGSGGGEAAAGGVGGQGVTMLSLPTHRDDSVSTVASDQDSGSSSVRTDPEEDDQCLSANSPADRVEKTSCPQQWLWTGAHQLHKPEGRCEDAFFECPIAMGIADGVGQMIQFAKYGVDSAAYATELMHNAAMAFQPGSQVASSLAPAGGPDALAAASVALADGESEAYGASTICVLCLQGRTLGAANLGDSGFIVLRSDTPDGPLSLVLRSEEQQHAWNCPYQLMRVPPIMAARLPRNTRPDSAADCRRYRFTVQPGDLLLLFTDGLSDNLFESEILDVVNREAATDAAEQTSDSTSETGGVSVGPLPGRPPPERLAKALAEAAREKSLDAGAEVPFCESARCHGHRFVGGKTDDITVVAAWVVDT